jgi:hypothetical protein
MIRPALLAAIAASMNSARLLAERRAPRHEPMIQFRKNVQALSL